MTYHTNNSAGARMNNKVTTSISNPTGTDLISIRPIIDNLRIYLYKFYCC